MSTSELLKETLEGYSLYYFIDRCFSDGNLKPTIIEEFPTDLLVVPTIAIEWGDIDGYEYELGNRDAIKERTWYLDVFAKTAIQKNELCYRIFNYLKDPVPVYNYNAGFPPTVVPAIGSLRTIKRSIRNVKAPALLYKTPEELYFRGTVTYTVVCDYY
jgi:hypothetical protein